MTTAINDLKTLAAAVAALQKKSPIQRALAAQVVYDAALSVLVYERRAAIYEATRMHTYEEVAAELGVSAAAVNAAVTQHRKANPQTALTTSRGRRRKATTATNGGGR